MYKPELAYSCSNQYQLFAEYLVEREKWPVQWRSYGGTLGEHWGNKVPPKIVSVFIYYCNDVKKRPQRGCSIQLVATETADAIMAIRVQGNYVIEITVKININE